MADTNGKPKQETRLSLNQRNESAVARWDVALRGFRGSEKLVMAKLQKAGAKMRESWTWQGNGKQDHWSTVTASLSRYHNKGWQSLGLTLVTTGKAELSCSCLLYILVWLADKEQAVRLPGR